MKWYKSLIGLVLFCTSWEGNAQMFSIQGNLKHVPDGTVLELLADKPFGYEVIAKDTLRTVIHASCFAPKASFSRKYFCLSGSHRERRYKSKAAIVWFGIGRWKATCPNKRSRINLRKPPVRSRKHKCRPCSPAADGWTTA